MTGSVFKLILLSVLISYNAFSQKDACASVADPQYGIQYANKPDQPAEFPGGKDTLNHFLEQHAALIRSGQASVCDAFRASVEFIIKKDGSVAFVKLLKPAGCDPLRRYIDEMFSRMPKWIPAMCNGKPVASRKNVSFSLQK